MDELNLTCVVCKESFTRKLGPVNERRFKQGYFELPEHQICKSCKQSKTLQETYGTNITNISQIPGSRQKANESRRKTCKEKYGCDPNSLESVKAKKAEALLRKYGVDNPAKIPNHKIKRRQTCILKYGKPNYTQTIEYKEKRDDTCIQKYGTTRVPNYRYLVDSVCLDSSWELAFYLYHRDLGSNIIREPIELCYEVDGKIRKYIPDFSVDGNLVEIKGPHLYKNGQLINPYNKSVTESIKLKAKLNCMLQNNVIILGREEIIPILKIVEAKYGKDFKEAYKNYGVCK